MMPKKDGVTDEFMLNGHFKEAYLQKCIDEHEIVRRLADNVIPDYLVYECDSLSLEDQLKIIENLDKTCVRYITFSGSKSYHVLFKIKVPEDITNEEYKEVWKDVMDYYNLRKYADEACASKSRLTRNPNGYRRTYLKDIFGNDMAQPTRIKQTCILDNPDCDTIDLTANVEAIRQQAIIDKAWNDERKKRLTNVFSKIEKTETPEEVISRIKKPCRAKEGYDMWRSGDMPSGFEYLGCARGMYSICIDAGCDENETLEFVRQYLLAVSEAHPSNISRRTAINWKPPKTH